LYSLISHTRHTSHTSHTGHQTSKIFLFAMILISKFSAYL